MRVAVRSLVSRGDLLVQEKDPGTRTPLVVIRVPALGLGNTKGPQGLASSNS